jgi:outer membrane protein TolC
VSVNIPIWVEKYAAGVREAEARYWAALHGKVERANILSARAKMVLYRFRDAQRKMDLYGNTLVPKGRESLKATEAAFRTGRASFTDLVDAERVLLEFQLSLERALASYAQRLAELEMLVGRTLPRVEPAPPEPVTVENEPEQPKGEVP